MENLRYSGYEWIGDIPAAWHIATIGSLYTERNTKVNDRDFPPLSVTMKGIVPQLATAAKSDAHDDRKLVCVGDFAINSRSDRRGSCGISPYEGSVSLINTILSPRGKMNPRYYNWLFHTELFADEFYKWGHGIVDDLWTTNWQNMKKIGVPVPPLQEQEIIADFLEKACGEIDAVIQSTQASIEEYWKLKRTIIAKAATQGLHDCPMKDSGIPWIGQIPSHWTISKVRYHIKWKSEKGQPDATVLSLYRDYGVIPKDSRDDNHNVTSLDTSGYKVVDIGDFVINKMKAWQGSMAVSDYRGIISPAYHVCSFTDLGINRKYFHHLMRNPLYLPEYTRLSTGMRIGQWDLAFDDFRNLPIVIPPSSEQQEIVDYIEAQSTELDKLIESKERFVAELDCYRKAIIYQYVTGKKEVPTA